MDTTTHIGSRIGDSFSVLSLLSPLILIATCLTLIILVYLFEQA